ncbi:MAG: FxsA family protein [Burkholderiales bacterium]|nr:FxsA family protein [Burkholderiales bacterium]
MPLILLGILVALPVLDIYATFRVAESLNVPGWALFLPGVGFGILLMKRETQTLKSRFVAALASVGVHGVVFDSGRRLLAAVLLLLPGVVSDLFALFLLMVPNRTPQTATVAAAGNAGPKTVDGEFRRVE